MLKLLATLVLVAGCADDKPAAPPQHSLVDLNSASAHELEKLPGIGDVAAKKIIAGRPYDRKDQLVSRGIVSELMYEKFKDLVIAKQR